MKYTTIKIDSKIAAKVKKHVKKRGMTIAFYVSHKLDYALKSDIATELIRDSITQPKD